VTPDPLPLDLPAPVDPPLPPGVALVRGWLAPRRQAELARAFREEWAPPPAGLRHPRVPTGARMGVASVCLGWHWQPYRYTRTAEDTDGAPVTPLPAGLARLAREAVAAAYGAGAPEARAYAPDAAIVNLYAAGVRLGLHQDREEPSEAPVVTLSLGDSALFRLGSVTERRGPYTDVRLDSGDLLVFGRASRRVFHAVTKVLPGTGPAELGVPGRLSITLRETGLA